MLNPIYDTMECHVIVETSGVNGESYVLFLSSELHDGLALLPDLVAQLLIGMPAHTQHALAVTHYSSTRKLPKYLEIYFSK